MLLLVAGGEQVVCLVLCVLKSMFRTIKKDTIITIASSLHPSNLHFVLANEQTIQPGGMQ